MSSDPTFHDLNDYNVRRPTACGPLLTVWLAATSIAAGCVSLIDNGAAEDEARRQACRAQQFATHVERARCHNLAEARLAEAIGADLAAVRHAARISIAERIDRKQISEADANLEFSNINTSITSQALARLDGRRAAEEAMFAAAAQRRTEIGRYPSTAGGPFECTTRPTYGGQTHTECQSTGVNFISSTR